VLTDARFPEIFKKSMTSLRRALNGTGAECQWLS
jgi:hypothetical protein